MKSNGLKQTVLAVSICIGLFFLILLSIYHSDSPVSVYSKQIYPKGTYKGASFSDEMGSVQKITISQDQANEIVNIIKTSNKKYVQHIESKIFHTVILSYSDSTINVILSDNNEMYYIIHNRKYCAASFKIESRALYQLILDILQENKSV